MINFWNIGITAERKSIYDDIEALREFGLDVQYKRGRPGGYYLAGGQEIVRHRSQFTKEKAGISKNAETEKKTETKDHFTKRIHLI